MKLHVNLMNDINLMSARSVLDNSSMTMVIAFDADFSCGSLFCGFLVMVKCYKNVKSYSVATTCGWSLIN